MNTKKPFAILQPFYTNVFTLIVSALLLNSVETYFYCRYSETISTGIILQSFCTITGIFCLYALAVLPLYFSIALWRKTPARIVLGVVFSIVFIFECALLIYNRQTGALMSGNELLQRPFSEIWITVQNSSNGVFNIFLISLVGAVFAFVPAFVQKKLFKNVVSIYSFLFILLLCSVGRLFYKYSDTYTESKSWYFFTSLFDGNAEAVDFEKGEGIEKNETLLQEYIRLYNPSGSADYPMERPATEYPDVLGAYFNKSERQPSVVIIIVESMGRYLMGEQGEKSVFMPFLDSLAHNGLYWKNCMASAVRTFAALPAITASAPLGVRGFQYGTMPQHYSLFTLLHENNYTGNFFYGADCEFDSMLDFLSIQNLDYCDDYDYRTTSKQKKEGLANGWGLFDHVLFDTSLKQLQKQTQEKPHASIFLTLTTHDAFNTDHADLKTKYETRAKKIFSSLPKHEQKYYQSVYDQNILAPFTYADDCLRNFIQNYCNTIDRNTIFIITGDHTTYTQKGHIPYYNVPLIIWSPLLRKAGKFPNIVSHSAIAPSIISYLQNNYQLQTPEKLAWTNTGLDTARAFNPQAKILLLGYNRTVDRMIYNQYFYHNGDKKAYTVNENLAMSEINDAKRFEEIQEKFSLLKYVNNYVYINNKLVRNNQKPAQTYRSVFNYKNAATVTCVIPAEPPSQKKAARFDLLPEAQIKGSFDKLKIQCSAEIVFCDSIAIQEKMKLEISCRGNKFRYSTKEFIIKYVLDDAIELNKPYTILIEKEIDVNTETSFTLLMQVITPESDSSWKPHGKITLSNVQVVVSGK